MPEYIPIAACGGKPVSHFSLRCAKEFFVDFDPLSASTLVWLNELGATSDAITTPVSLRCGRVTFDPLVESFSKDVLGERALIAPVIHDGTIIDAVAWSVKSKSIATRFGEGYALGQGQVMRDGYGAIKPLPVFRNLIGWLRASRRGLVVVDFAAAAHALAGLALEAEDARHARELSDRLKVLPPRITVGSVRQ